MQSKISCFNKTIFKKNLTRFWPFAVLYGVYLIFAHPLILYVALSAGRNMGGNEQWNSVANHLTAMTEPISILIFAIVMMTAVFGYLFQSRSANMLHTFPVTRGELYVTNFVSAWILMLIPQFLAALAMNMVVLGKVNGLIWAVWAWFGITAGETLFFLGLAVFSVMLSGQLLPAAVLYMVWNLLYVAVVGLIDAVAELFIFGLNGELISLNAHVLFPAARLMRYVGFQIGGTEQTQYLLVKGTGTLAGYLLVGLLFAAAAYYAYRKRSLECAGDFLSFRFTRPIFRWGIAIIGGAAASLIVAVILSDGRGARNHAVTLFIIWLVIFSGILFFVAEMFIEKSFRVFKRRTAIECVSCIAVLLVGISLLHFDIFGVESYVPDVSKVEMVELSGDGSASFESEEDIEKITEFHRLILEHIDECKKLTDENRMDNTDFLYVGIHYRMTNGKQVDRGYSLWIDDKEYMKELWKAFSMLMYDSEATKRSLFGMNYDELNWKVTNVTLNYYTNEGEMYEPVYGSEEELSRFYEAALADIEAGAFTNTDILYENGEASVRMGSSEDGIPMDAIITLGLMTDQPRENIRFAGSSYISELQDVIGGSRTGSATETFLYLNSKCTNLIKVLIDMDVIEKAEDLSVAATKTRS